MKKEHVSVKAKRLDDLSEADKTLLLTLDENKMVFRIKIIAHEYNVTYNTLHKRINYWKFLKTQAL